MVWSGFKGVSPTPALVANCPDMPHDPAEVDRLPADDPTVPYVWGVRDIL
jgi:dTDP-4-dehydrorhamnose 3,5-epimerase